MRSNCSSGSSRRNSGCGSWANMTLPVEVQCAGIVRPSREATRTAAGPSTAATKRTLAPSNIPT